MPIVDLFRLFLKNISVSRPFIQIADALDQLIETKNRILVIGREHILSRPVADLDRIRSKASLFLTKDE